MDTALLNKKLDKNKKPIKYVTIAGIILATITFFVLLYLILHLIFNVVLALFGGFNYSNLAKLNANQKANANASATTTVTTGEVYQANGVQQGFSNAGYANAGTPTAGFSNAGFSNANTPTAGFSSAGFSNAQY